MFQAAAQEISEPSFTPSRIDELIQTAALKPVCSSDNEEPFVGAKFNLHPSRWRGCIISKGRKRRAFAIDGPLATPDLRGDNVLSNEPAMFFYSSDRRMSEKLIASSRQDNSGPADDKSQEQAWPLPPCSSRRTPMMTPHQDLVSSPVTNELSRFGSLALQSPSSCFQRLAQEERDLYPSMISRPASEIILHLPYRDRLKGLCRSPSWDQISRIYQELLQGTNALLIRQGILLFQNQGLHPAPRTIRSQQAYTSLLASGQGFLVKR